MQEIIYEPHPVSPERKAELRAAGYRIVDAAFKPAEPAAPVPLGDIGAMNRNAVISALAERGVAGATGKLADLRALLAEVVDK